MSDQVLLAIIAAMASMVASTIAAGVAIYTGRKVERVERQTNGMVGMISEQARTAGFESGRAAVRAGDRRANGPEEGHTE